MHRKGDHPWRWVWDWTVVWVPFSALTLLVGWQEGHLACKTCATYPQKLSSGTSGGKGLRWKLAKQHSPATHTHNCFMAVCLGLTGWAGVRRNLPMGFYGAREDNRGRHTDHLAWHHSIRSNQRPISNIPHFYAGCASCCSPPTLSWLGTGTIICWLVYPVACFPSGVVPSGMAFTWKRPFNYVWSIMYIIVFV